MTTTFKNCPTKMKKQSNNQNQAAAMINPQKRSSSSKKEQLIRQIPQLALQTIYRFQLHCPSPPCCSGQMGRNGSRIPSFCLNRIRPHARVRTPVATKTKPTSESKQETESNLDQIKEEKPSEFVKPAVAATGRKIMIVMDSSFEAKGALQWALSHTIQNQDTIILLHVTKPHPNQGEESPKGAVAPKVNELLQSMKNTCQLKKPEVKVELQVVEGKEKGAVIVEEARKHGVAILVLGQKKQSMTWRLLMTWAGNRVSGNFVEHCIQNAACMAIAVRRKSKKHGGFLITTKRHKDFWLLA